MLPSTWAMLLTGFGFVTWGASVGRRARYLMEIGMATHPASEAHHKAADKHKEAEQSHRLAAEAHDAGEHDDARSHADQAHQHGKDAAEHNEQARASRTDLPPEASGLDQNPKPPNRPQR